MRIRLITLKRIRILILFDEDLDAEPDPDPCFLIKAQTLEKVFK
jgi:hypothetical protein